MPSISILQASETGRSDKFIQFKVERDGEKTANSIYFNFTCIRDQMEPKFFRHWRLNEMKNTFQLKLEKDGEKIRKLHVLQFYQPQKLCEMENTFQLG